MKALSGILFAIVVAAPVLGGPLNTAQLAALSIDAETHSEIQRLEQDATPAYINVVQPLRAILETVPTLRFAYTVRTDGDSLRFGVDATPSGDRDADGINDHSFVGELYEDPDPALVRAAVLGTTAVSEEPYKDRWGTFVSAFAPVRNPDGSIECFVGIDMNAADYEERIAQMSRAERAGLGVAALASGVLGVIVYGLRRRGRMAQLNERLAAERLERTASNVPGAIYEFCEAEDGSQTMPFASRGLFDVLGVQPSDVRADAERLFDCVVEEDRERVLATWAKARMMHVQWNEQFRVRTPESPERWVECHAKPSAPQGDVTVWYGHVGDISDRKQVELALEQAKLAAESASKAKNEIVAKVSHELRTPIAAISGYTELLRDGTNQGQGAEQISDREALDAILRNSTHLLALVNDILDVARIEAGQIRMHNSPTSLSELAKDIMDGLRLRVGSRRLSLHTQVDADVPQRIVTDPVRLRQVLINLVTNAVKFTDRGSVWMTVRRDGPDRVAISVRDTGPGMTSEQVSKLFQPFMQVDNSMSRGFSGAGLGLAISKQLVDLMGGRIAVQSTPGRGTEFTVRLPLIAAPDGSGGTGDSGHGKPRTASASDTAIRPGASERLALAGGGWGAVATSIAGPALLEGCRILVAEDGPDNARLICHHLRTAGAIVTHVWDGRGALRLVEGRGDGDEAPFDLILLDMQMPVMDGYAATENMRAHGVTLPIVALTAHSTPADRARCTEVGCTDYACKPISRTALMDLCHKWARKPAVAGVSSVPAPQ